MDKAVIRRLPKPRLGSPESLILRMLTKLVRALVDKFFVFPVFRIIRPTNPSNRQLVTGSEASCHMPPRS